MGVFGYIAIVTDFSSVIHRLDMPFICKMCQIPVHRCQSNPVVKEFLVELLGGWVIVTVDDGVMNGSLLPRHSTMGLVRR